jgi:predicted kinase
MKPDIIYITGAPGSGKSTLAKLLADKMYSYTHIDPDNLLQSFWEKNKDPDYDREKVGVPKMQKILTTLLADDVRLIVDAQADRELLQALNDKYRLVNVHCVAENPAQRFYERETASDGSKPDWLDPHMPEIHRLAKEASEPIDIGQQIIVVDCSGEYSPSVDKLLHKLGF